MHSSVFHHFCIAELENQDVHLETIICCWNWKNRQSLNYTYKKSEIKLKITLALIIIAINADVILNFRSISEINCHNYVCNQCTSKYRFQGYCWNVCHNCVSRNFLQCLHCKIEANLINKFCSMPNYHNVQIFSIDKR